MPQPVRPASPLASSAETPLATHAWQPVLFAALAGGMGWGIRGQYGHETGAMIAGLLVSSTLVYLLCPRRSSLSVTRAVAWGTVAMGLGGSMTYGQTVGLTHDGPLLGNWAALRWGMLGLGIKGGLWIGLVGVFLGMGLGGIRYRVREMTLLMLALIGAYFMGTSLLNGPFDPANRKLPAIYFSDNWYWEPAGGITPRSECWGGLLAAFLLLVVYTGWARKDRLARNLAFWGMLGGALGFPLGQSIQAWAAWNRDFLSTGPLASIPFGVNWWNMMETTYGAVMGGVLGLGCWRNRHWINPVAPHARSELTGWTEVLLLLVHLPMLLTTEFLAIRAVDALYDLGLIMAIIPMVAILGGRWWPYLQIFPLTLIPIAGKTTRQLVYGESAIHFSAGWLIYFIGPLLIATLLTIYSIRREHDGEDGRVLVRRSLLWNTWIYFGLNYAFFHYPWPWATWTGRTPNGLIFTICAVGLTWLALHRR